MRLPDSNRRIDKRIRLADVASRAAPIELADDYVPPKWEDILEEVERCIFQNEIPRLLRIAESYYLICPDKRDQIVGLLPKEKIKSDVEFSLKNGFSDMPAEFQSFFPDDPLFPLSEEYWLKMKARVSELEPYDRPDMCLDQVIDAIRLFPNKRGELEQTPEYWLQRIGRFSQNSPLYIGYCCGIALLFPAVAGILRDSMQQDLEGFKKGGKFYANLDLGTKVRLQMLEGKIVLKPDGQYGFVNKSRLTTNTELPPRVGV